MTHRLVRLTDVDSRRLRTVLDDADVSTAGSLKTPETEFQIPVVVAGPTEFPSEDPDGTVNDRPLRELNGIEWADTVQPVPVRRITNGNQIAWPVGANGLCVQDVTFWAVNVGSLAAATHPLTGHSEGVAAVLAVKDDGDLEITDARLDFVNRDGNAVADGTLIQLQYCSGTLTIVWAACEAHEDLEGLEVAPE